MSETTRATGEGADGGADVGTVVAVFAASTAGMAVPKRDATAFKSTPNQGLPWGGTSWRCKLLQSAGELMFLTKRLLVGVAKKASAVAAAMADV